MAIKNSGDSGLFPDYWDDGDIKRWHKTLFCLDSDIIESLFEVNDAVMTVMGNGMSLTELKAKYPADQNMADRQTIADCETIEELKTWELYRRKELFIKMFSDPQQSWGGYIIDCDNGAAVMSRIATVRNSLSERGFLMSASFEPSNLFNILVRENRDYRQQAEADRDEFLRSFDRTVIRRLLIDEGVSEEYIDQIELTDRNPKAFTKQELMDKKFMSVCNVPALFKEFQFTEKLFEIRYDHLHIMQLAEEDGVFSVKDDTRTHYHNLGLDFLYRLPLFLTVPDLIFATVDYDTLSKNQTISRSYEKKLLNRLACVLPERVEVTLRNGDTDIVPILAFIEPGKTISSKKAVVVTAYPKKEYYSMLNYAISNNQLLFLKNEKTLRRDCSGSYSLSATTVSMMGSFITRNISEFIQNVNIERLKNNKILFEDIPVEQLTKKICNFAFSQDITNIKYFPQFFISKKMCQEIFEASKKSSQVKKYSEAIKYIPDTMFTDVFVDFLRENKSFGHRAEMVFNFINNNASQSQKNLIEQKIVSELANENKMSDEDIKFLLDDDLRIYKFVEWSDGNLKPPKYLKASRIPKHILEEAGMEESETRETSAHVLDIIGQKVEMDENGNITERGWDRLSRAVNAYSDKNYETARYFFVKDGVIVRHKAVTSGNPSRTIIAPSNDYLYQMRVFAEENGCKIVFMHNHPSGYVVPSEADIELTERMERYFVGGNGDSLFLGHIISDHGNFGLYAPNDSNSWVAMIDGKFQPMMKINEVYKLQPSEYGIHIRTDSDLILLKEKAMELDAGNIWNKDLWIPCFYATINGIPKSLEYISVHSFSDGKGLSEQIRKLGKENNSDYIYLFPNTREQFYMCERFAQDSRMVRNVYFSREGGGFELSQFSGGNIFQQDRLSMNDIKLQDSDTYGKATIDRIIADRQVEEQMELFKASEAKQNWQPEKALDIDLRKVIVFDLETTGVQPGVDEILQVSIKNGLGETLLNSLVKPDYAKRWPFAQKVNNISPKSVQDAPSIGDLKEQIQSIFDKAELTLSYNGEFDITFLEAAGIDTHKGSLRHMDIIKSSARAYGEQGKGRTSIDGFKYKKLTDIAEYYGIEYKAHDAAGDTDATLEVAKRLYGNDLVLLSDAEYEKNKVTFNEFRIIDRQAEKYFAKVGYELLNRRNDILDSVDDKNISDKVRRFRSGKAEKRELSKIYYNIGSRLYTIMPDMFNEVADGIRNRNGRGKKSQVPSENIMTESLHSTTNEKLTNILTKKISSFEFENYNFISVRKFADDNEKQFVFENIKDKVRILKSEMLKHDFPVEDFTDKGEGADIFYCIEKGCFYVPTEKGLVPMSGSSSSEVLDKKYSTEVESFRDKNYKELKILSFVPFHVNAKSTMMDISSMLEMGDSFSVKSPNIGNVKIFKGTSISVDENRPMKENIKKIFDKDGIIHSVAHRYFQETHSNANISLEDMKAIKEKTSAIIFLAVNNISKSPAVRESKGNWAVYKNGIKTVIDIDKKRKRQMYMVTGFDYDATKREATETISAVIAQYGNTPEFLDIYAQVGAVVDPLQNRINQEFNSVNIKNGISGKKINEMTADELRRLADEYDRVGAVNGYDFNGKFSDYPNFNGKALNEPDYNNLKEKKNMAKKLTLDEVRSLVSETTVKENVGEPAEVKQMELADILFPMSLGYEVSDGKIILNAFAWGEGGLVAFTDEFLDEINSEGMENIHDVLAAIDGYLDGHAQNFAQEIGEYDNITTWREAVSYIQEHGDTEFPKEYTDVFNALLKPDNILIDKLDVHEQGVSHDGISANVEQNQGQEQEFIGNDVSDEAVVVDTVSMSDTIDETDSVQFGDMENIDDDLGITGKQNPANVQAEKSPELLPFEKQVAELTRQNEQILELINSLKEQNEKLREENQMLREQLQQGVSPGYEGQNSQGYSNSGITDYGNADQSDNTMLNPNEFSRFNAWQVGQPVPVFGVMNESGEVELLKNCVFRSFERDELSPGKGKVILDQMQKDGNVRRIELDESRYKEMINASERLHKALEQRDSMGNLSVDKNSFEYEQYQEQYRKSMMIDQDLFRTNYACNFVHNFKVACKLYANNPDEAMEIAKKQFNDMTKDERRRLQKEIAEYDKQFGEGAYDKLLLDQYVSSKKNQTFKDFSVSGISFNSDSNDLIKDVNKEHFELPAGTPLRNDDVGDTGFKVGDSVKIGFSYTDMLGKTRNIPVSDFKIMRVSKNIQPEKSVVYCEEYKVAYELPTKELMNHLKNMSIMKKQEQFQENEKERKKYGLDVKKFLREF